MRVWKIVVSFATTQFNGGFPSQFERYVLKLLGSPNRRILRNYCLGNSQPTCVVGRVIDSRTKHGRRTPQGDLIKQPEQMAENATLRIYFIYIDIKYLERAVDTTHRFDAWFPIASDQVLAERDSVHFIGLPGHADARQYLLIGHREHAPGVLSGHRVQRGL